MDRDTTIDDDKYDIDVDSWTTFDGDDEDYCYGCEDWTDNDGHGNCKACGVKFDSIDGDGWATAHTSKSMVATAPTISTTGDIYGRAGGFTWGSGGTSWWQGSSGGSLSSMWGGTHTYYGGNENAEAYRLLKHKNHLDSLCKVVDPTVKHMLSFSSHSSGHTNMATGQIVIDGDLLKDSDDNLDITAGLAIHEKLHLVYSNDLMKWENDARSRMTTTQGQSMLLHDICNIIEDEYIEKQLATTSKGFVHYIEKCKKHYFVDGFEKMGKTKDAFADLINTFMLFVRYPSLIDTDRRKRHAPHIRFFARTMSTALNSRENTYTSMESIFSYLLKAFDKMNEGSDDKKLEEAMDRAETKVGDMMESFAKSGVDISDKEWEAIREKLKAEYTKEEKAKDTDDLYESMKKADDIIKALTGEDYDESKFIDDDLMEKIKELEETDYSETELDKALAISSSQRKITWQKAKNDSYHSDRYRAAKRRVKKEISKLKKKVQLYGNMEKYTIRNQKRGKLDKRMLHRIPSGRMDLFKAEIVKEDKPLDICLLVDESGSMGSYCMDYARMAAISIKEAMADNEMLNLWVYGHSADEQHRGDTEMIEYWSPSMQDRPMAMGGMKARYENRDGNAIIASADRVNSETDQPNGKKLMIVLSDGAPSADGYRGRLAYDHVRKCVKNIESKGWDVIQLGFAGSRTSEMAMMFSNYVYIDDTSKIGDKVSKVIRKVLKI
jgi:Mg-chelatase subunit ChlD